MGSGITTVVAAALAVLGTLLGTLMSPVLTQRNNARSKQQEFDLQQRQRQEEREWNRQQQDFADLRDTYTELNREMRKFWRALNTYVELIRQGNGTNEALAVLEDARHSYGENYSNAQMTVSDEVLAAAQRINRGLLDVYGTLRRLDGSQAAAMTAESPSRARETVDSAFAYLKNVLQEQLTDIRHTMRTEIGAHRH